MKFVRIKNPISSDGLIDWLSRIIPLAVIVGVVSLLKERGIWYNPNFQKTLIILGFCFFTAILLYYLYRGFKHGKKVVGNFIANRPRMQKVVLISYILIITFLLIGKASLTSVVGLTFIFGAIYILLSK